MATILLFVVKQVSSTLFFYDFFPPHSWALPLDCVDFALVQTFCFNIMIEAYARTKPNWTNSDWLARNTVMKLLLLD